MITITALFSILIFAYQDCEKKQNKYQEQFHVFTMTPRIPFSVPDYLNRMEKLHLKALQERENEEPHIIVLWWGFDGLRLNADGTTEWINRRPKEDYVRTEYQTWIGEDMHVQTSDGCGYIYHDGQYFLTEIPERIVFNSADYLQPTTLDDCSATWKIPSKEAQIAALQSQLQAVNMQQWQNEQIQSMINVIESGRDINGRLRRWG